MTAEKRLTTPNAILHKALEKELQARDFYANLAMDCHVDFVKDLLLTLQIEESKHAHMIKDMLSRMEAG